MQCWLNLILFLYLISVAFAGQLINSLQHGFTEDWAEKDGGLSHHVWSVKSGEHTQLAQMRSMLVTRKRAVTATEQKKFCLYTETSFIVITSAFMTKQEELWTENGQ